MTAQCKGQKKCTVQGAVPIAQCKVTKMKEKRDARCGLHSKKKAQVLISAPKEPRQLISDSILIEKRPARRVALLPSHCADLLGAPSARGTLHRHPISRHSKKGTASGEMDRIPQWLRDKTSAERRHASIMFAQLHRALVKWTWKRRRVHSADGLDEEITAPCEIQ